MKCIHCDAEASFVDTDYDEGYCTRHFDIQQQQTSEPIQNYRAV